MKTNGYKTTIVGLLIAVSLILAAASILTIGREQGLFRDRASFMTDFPNATGLSAGSPVRFIGVQVGIVEKVSLPPEAGTGRVDVRLGIDRDVRGRIRQGTTATLRNLTYLSGEKYVELRPGPADQELLEEGAYIESPRSEIQRLIAQSQTIATNVEQISVEFTEILASLNAGESVLSQLIKDPQFGQQIVGETTSTLANLNIIVSRIERGEGLVGRLLADDEFGRTTFETVTAVLQRMDRITSQVESGEGFIGQLLAEDSKMVTLQDDLVSLVADLRDIVGKIDSGQGLVGQLVVDEDYGRTMTLRLDAALASMASILQKIDEGEGTMSLLLNEPELYNDATEVVGGLSDSRFLKWVAKRMRNKDIKRQIEEYAVELEEAEKAARQ